MKYHKANIASNSKGSLINSVISEVDLTSKYILSDINNDKRRDAKLSPWRNANEVSEWNNTNIGNCRAKST